MKTPLKIDGEDLSLFSILLTKISNYFYELNKVW